MLCAKVSNLLTVLSLNGHGLLIIFIPRTPGPPAPTAYGPDVDHLLRALETRFRRIIFHHDDQAVVQDPDYLQVADMARRA